MSGKCCPEQHAKQIWWNDVAGEERKTEEGVVGQHQGMVPDGHPHSQQEGVGSSTVGIIVVPYVNINYKIR